MAKCKTPSSWFLPLSGASEEKTRYGFLQVIASIDGRGERASEGIVDGGSGSQSPQLLFLLG